MKRSALLLGSLVLTISLSAQAECASYGCPNVYVEQLYVNADYHIYIQTSGTETLANCTPKENIFFVLPLGVANYSQIYATLLAAQLADKRVTIRITEGTNPCSIAYVTLARQ